MHIQLDTNGLSQCAGIKSCLLLMTMIESFVCLAYEILEWHVNLNFVTRLHEVCLWGVIGLYEMAHSL